MTATVHVLAKGRTGTHTYEIAPHKLQVVNLSAFRDTGTLTVDVSLTGDGTVMVGKASSDATLARITTLPHVASANDDASHAMRVLTSAAFKAAPFQEPATGLVFMRGRWYDPQTGSFLSPDPQGYAESANLYAYCHGDPVNCTDPTGQLGDGGDLRADFRARESAERAKGFAAWCTANPVECRKVDVRGAGILRMVGGVGQTTAGVGAFASSGPLPEPVTKGLGGTAIVRGIDNTVTGAVELWTGEQHDTMTGRALYLAMVNAGVSPVTASKVTGWTEVGVDVTSTLGSTAAAAYNARHVEVLTRQEQLVRQLHYVELGSDPARGMTVGTTFSAREAETAIRLEAQVGRLSRSADVGDWLGANGKVYDAVGPVPGGHFNLQSFTSSLRGHLLKQGVDIIVVDLSGMAAQDAAAVDAYVRALSTAQRARVLVLR